MAESKETLYFGDRLISNQLREKVFWFLMIHITSGESEYQQEYQQEVGVRKVKWVINRAFRHPLSFKCY